MSATIRRPPCMLYPLIAAAAVLTFYPMARWMLGRFTEEGSYYSHGFLVPLLVVWLIRRKRPALAALPVAPATAGLVLATAGLAGYIVCGVLFGIGFLGGLSFLLTVIGFCWYLFGAGITRAVLAPLLFLLFMIPVPQVLLIAVAFKLKMLSAALAGWCLHQLSCTVYRAGSILYIPGGALVVESECSGISSLLSLFSLSAVLAYLSKASFPRRLLVVASSVPIAVIANAARIVFLALAAYIYGIEAAADKVVHYGAGMVLWIAALAMFAAAGRMIRWGW